MTTRGTDDLLPKFFLDIMFEILDEKTFIKKTEKKVPIQYPRINEIVVRLYSQNIDRLITDQAASDIRCDIEYQYKNWVMDHKEKWLKDQEKQTIMEVIENSFSNTLKQQKNMTPEEIANEKTKFKRQTQKAGKMLAIQTNPMNYPISPSILAANREDIEAFK